MKKRHRFHDGFVGFWFRGTWRAGLSEIFSITTMSLLSPVIYTDEADIHLLLMPSPVSMLPFFICLRQQSASFEIIAWREAFSNAHNGLMPATPPKPWDIIDARCRAHIAATMIFLIGVGRIYRETILIINIYAKEACHISKRSIINANTLNATFGPPAPRRCYARTPLNVFICSPATTAYHAFMIWLILLLVSQSPIKMPRARLLHYQLSRDAILHFIYMKIWWLFHNIYRFFVTHFRTR